MIENVLMFPLADFWSFEKGFEKSQLSWGWAGKGSVGILQEEKTKPEHVLRSPL